MFLAHGQPDFKFGSFSFPAVDINDAVVQKDDLFGQRKPNPGAGLVAVFGIICLVKTVENVDDLFL
jgi:hypothetical protein